MVRAGYSEPEITQAVERSTAPEDRSQPRQPYARLKALFGISCAACDRRSSVTSGATRVRDPVST